MYSLNVGLWLVIPGVRVALDPKTQRRLSINTILHKQIQTISIYLLFPTGKETPRADHGQWR